MVASFFFLLYDKANQDLKMTKRDWSILPAAFFMLQKEKCHAMQEMAVSQKWLQRFFFCATKGTKEAHVKRQLSSQC